MPTPRKHRDAASRQAANRARKAAAPRDEPGYGTPDASFLRDCAFVCVDLTPPLPVEYLRPMSQFASVEERGDEQPENVNSPPSGITFKPRASKLFVFPTTLA